MFDPWLSECAKYNAVISITVKLPGNRSNMCHTEWRGSESTKQAVHVYKEKQTDPTNEEVGKQTYNMWMLQSHSKNQACVKKKKSLKRN